MVNWNDPNYDGQGKTAAEEAIASREMLGQVIVMIIVLAWLCVSCFGLWLLYQWLITQGVI